MTVIQIETEVLRLAADELGFEDGELSLGTRLESIFADSLEYISFTLRLAELGHLSEEAISKAETLGDLANALINPN